MSFSFLSWCFRFFGTITSPSLIDSLCLWWCFFFSDFTEGGGDWIAAAVTSTFGVIATGSTVVFLLLDEDLGFLSSFLSTSGWLL